MFAVAFVFGLVGVLAVSAATDNPVIQRTCAVTKCRPGHTCVMELPANCIFRKPCYEEPKCVPIKPKKCYHRGRFYPVGDFQDANFPCEHCRCYRNGTVECVLQDCARPPCENPVHLPGVCCPQCPPDGFSCYYEGEWYIAGDFQPPTNPCAFCQCNSVTGQVTCSFIKCPKPACNNPVFVPGECCPFCPGPGEVCYHGGHFHPVGFFQDPNSPCEHCRCYSNGTVECFLQDCARPPCEDPVGVPGVCCPQCPSGPDCSTVRCARPLCSNPVTPVGQCCPECPTITPDCSAVLCVRPLCPNPITPAGQCCPTCPPGPKLEMDVLGI